MRVSVLGAGVAGLVCAVELAEHGAQVQVLECSRGLGASSCSWFAGGMLAPWCELENSEPLIARLGIEGLAWWREHFDGTVLRGSLVVAHRRDQRELDRFAQRTQCFRRLDGDGIAELEPDLAGRFDRALYFPDEGHLDPRLALSSLARRLERLGVAIQFQTDPNQPTSIDHADEAVVDCTGLAARATLADLRGVKGEMLVLREPQLALTRPVRVLHPRTPLYVVPRGGGVYMVGATAIESDLPSRVSARSMLELLGAAYAVHPAFGEAEVLEIGTGVRPAFPDNLPRLCWRDGKLFVNGLYRHGFLLAPALARRAAQALQCGRHFPEVMTDENSRQRRCA
jgi:glycine oxidase